MAQIALRRASRELPRVLIDSPRMWVWTALWGLAGTGAGVYFSFEHGRNALVLITVGAAAGGLVAALLTAFLALWLTAPFRSLRDDVRKLAADVADLGSRDSRQQALRVALYAVRSELASCAIAINEARERQSWWNPEVDELPASKWTEHFAALSDPTLPDAVNVKIEDAYQLCIRMNKRIRHYIKEHAQTHFPMGFVVTPPVLKFRDGDDALLHETRKAIDATNIAISQYLASDATGDGSGDSGT